MIGSDDASMESEAAVKVNSVSDVEEKLEDGEAESVEPPCKRLKVNNSGEENKGSVEGSTAGPSCSKNIPSDTSAHAESYSTSSSDSLRDEKFNNLSSERRGDVHEESCDGSRSTSVAAATVSSHQQQPAVAVEQETGDQRVTPPQSERSGDVDHDSGESDDGADSSGTTPRHMAGDYLENIVNAELYEAVLDEDIEAVRNCLARGAHPDHSWYHDDEDYETALHAAVGTGRADIVKLLLEQHPMLTFINQDHQTPLHLAAKIGNVEICRLLVADGEAIHHHDRMKYIPLFYATHNVEIVELLLAAGSNVDATSRHGDTPLTVACKSGHWPAVMALIKAGANVNVQSGEGVTPLMMAARRGHAEMVYMLLQSGASADASNITGMTVLHDAALSEKGNCVLQVLIEAGCDIEVRCERNQTPLIYAIQFIRPDAVCQLIKANCKICYSVYTFGHNFTPFQMAFLQCEQMASSADSGARLTEKECNRVCSLLRIMRMLVCAGAKVSSPTINIHVGLRELATCAGFLESRGYGRDPGNTVAMLTQALNNPHSLAELTRTKLRTLLGRGIKQKLSTVQLPEFIHNFILLSDLQGV